MRAFAKRAGILKEDVAEVLERLIRLEMLKIIDGQYVRSVSKYRTTEDISNSSLRKSHAQTLDLAQLSLEADPVEARDFTWLTLPMDMKKMSLAKTMIRKFQDDLSAALEMESNPGEVYRLAIQLFPLTKIKTKEEQ